MNQDSAPTIPPVTRDPPTMVKPASALPLFIPETRVEADAFGHDAVLAPVAELLAHPRGGSPMTVGLFGGPGAGKSAASTRLMARVDALASASARTSAPVFLSRVLGARVAAGELARGPAIAIASALNAALIASQRYAALAAEAAREATDPHVAARQATERLDHARKTLDVERKALEDIEGRKARLVDSILFETAGSRIDAYARANRTTIENRLRGFGFDGECIATFKELAREAHEHAGFAGAIAAFARSLWFFKGQAKLLVWAVVMFLLAGASHLARDNAELWLGALRGVGEQTTPVADWAAAHLSWLNNLRAVANDLGALLIIVNVARALRFLATVRRGASLLANDIATKRGQIETAVAHQTRRVDALTRETESLSTVASEAEKRAEGRAGIADIVAFPGASDEAAEQADAFIAHVAGACARGDAGAPQRIIAVIDELDALPPARAAECLRAAGKLLSREGFATIVSTDPMFLARAFDGQAAAADEFDRAFQTPVSLPDPGRDSDGMSAFARALLTNPRPPVSAPVDASACTLDAPLQPVETALVSTLAPFAARSPRAAKRFVNLYRLARGRAPDSAALAMMLALDAGATSVELAAMGAAMDGDGAAEIAIGVDQPRLAFALAATNKARGKPLTIGDARTAWSIARDYRMPL